MSTYRIDAAEKSLRLASSLKVIGKQCNGNVILQNRDDCATWAIAQAQFATAEAIHMGIAAMLLSAEDDKKDKD